MVVSDSHKFKGIKLTNRNPLDDYDWSTRKGAITKMIKFKSEKLEKPKDGSSKYKNLYNKQTAENREMEKVLVEGMTNKFVTQVHEPKDKKQIKLPQILSLKDRLKKIEQDELIEKQTRFMTEIQEAAKKTNITV